MLQVGDTVKMDLVALASFPQWWKNREETNIGAVTEAEHNGWVTVKWTKPRWYDPDMFECVEIAELCLKQEAENVNI